MHTTPPWQTQNMVQPNLALLQPQRKDEHGLSLSHWHSDVGSTPRGTLIGDKVWVASLRSHPLDLGDITGGSSFKACIQVQACTYDILDK